MHLEQFDAIPVQKQDSTQAAVTVESYIPTLWDFVGQIIKRKR